MTDSLRTERDMRRVMMVNMFSLPLVFVLVAMGFALTQPAGTVRVASLGLLVFSVAFNLITMKLIGQGVGGHAFRLTRIYTNLAVNVALVYLLGRHWLPMWLILVVTPVSAAIYGTRRHTAIACVQTVTAILGIRLLYGHQSVIQWGEGFAQALFVTCLSFLINAAMRSGEPPAGERPLN